jgi:hypothetical protein
MASSKVTAKASEGETPAPEKKVSPKKATPEGGVSSAPTAAAAEAPDASRASPPDEAAPCTRSHIPNARTRKALQDADTGKDLTRYDDVDDLFRKLGIKLGQE